MKFVRTIRLTLLLCAAVAATLVPEGHAFLAEFLFLSNATSFISTGALPNLEYGGYAFWVPLLAMVLSIAWVSLARKPEWWIFGDAAIAFLIAVDFVCLLKPFSASGFDIYHALLGLPTYGMLCGLLIIDLLIISKLKNRPRGRAGIGP